ncbi:MAG: metallophosphoesterase [Desulfobulbaceae bacterium]|nr:metallophosphoesterase [Desulfobulbaceae bacterium]
MTSIGWLQLSDLHQGMGPHNWHWPNVREIIFNDINDLHGISGPWDIIFFTGDMTQTGAQEEFEQFETTLAELIEHLNNLGSNPVFVAVPGNHDLLRPKAEKEEIELLQRWHDDPTIEMQFWKEPSSSSRLIINKSFNNFTHWWDRSSLPRPQIFKKGPLPGDFSATIRKKDYHIGILGINSAFLQLNKGDYRGRLAVGLPQFNESCEKDGPTWSNSHDICFLMTHHPLQWLSPRAQQVLKGEIATPGRFAAHLFGHMHKSQTKSISTGGQKPWRSWQGPALFGLERYGTNNETRTHGYLTGRIEIKETEGRIRIWPRSGIRQESGNWIIVPDHKSFALEKDLGTPSEVIQIIPKHHRMVTSVNNTVNPEQHDQAETGTHQKRLSKINPTNTTGMEKGMDSFTKTIINISLVNQLGSLHDDRSEKAEVIRKSFSKTIQEHFPRDTIYSSARDTFWLIFDSATVAMRKSLIFMQIWENNSDTYGEKLYCKIVIDTGEIYKDQLDNSKFSGTPFVNINEIVSYIQQPEILFTKRTHGLLEKSAFSFIEYDYFINKSTSDKIKTYKLLYDNPRTFKDSALFDATFLMSEKASFAREKCITFLALQGFLWVKILQN